MNIRPRLLTALFLTAFCVVFWSCGLGLADENDPIGHRVKQGELEDLVARLGAPQYVVREEATTRLFDVGRGEAGEMVRKTLERAGKQSDREVRERAQRVLALLNEQLQVERLAQFMGGGKAENVPGWAKFSQRYGDTKASRSVYGELLKEEWELLAACFAADENEGGVRMAVNQRFAELMTGQYGYQSISLGSILSLFFIGTEHPASVDLHSQLFHLLRTSTSLGQRLRGAPANTESSRGVIRTLVGSWLLATVRQDNRYEPSAIAIALRGSLFAEAKAVAEHILTNPNSLPVSKRTAMQTYSGLKDPAGIPLIEPYLKDETQLRQDSKRLQLRDIALTCLMDLHGHDVTRIRVQRTNDVLNPYDYSTLGFDQPEDRQQAFELFKELQEEKQFLEKQATEKRDATP